jgi:hypothetical protein
MNRKMKARINGIEIEGTMDEIIAFKDAMDDRERRQYFKVVITHETTDVSKEIKGLMNELHRRNPYFVY